MGSCQHIRDHGVAGRDFRQRRTQRQVGKTLLAGSLFELLYSGAEAQGRIRPGLKRPVVEVLFWQVVTGFFDYPTLQAQGLSPAEVFRTIVDVLLNGILIPAPPGRRRSAVSS